ncbi:hypothetical protein ASPACDRAFT_52314 [Aspergillus aculeatus ATCC 16872]|uniref:Major facilitator superfamily (MFS) profile domain-containing protein n=1 Tax=Aspergillus aculeatus (strain ATCC 16872 / CBS 172.66 / WB 5094) TaxID=690307 RepID=A0A1L9WTS2_ASPA1|nr:uncharacterized protein ASPACDRAFT_52314 [Aspergillus aculeatus ATCC 16872]OJJ99626.1 hypothetical protein ASPACDRAFT_52314 [Aspergillus aculeatus ATCC 16872]
MRSISSVEHAALPVPHALFSDEPPPNSGLTAWLQVLAGHLVVFNAWGYANSFGIFQSYYASSLNLPASTISWIGSTQVFLIFLIGAVSGRAFDTGYLSRFGNGLTFCPTIALISTYFTTKRTIAISTAASGAATGGIIFPMIAEQLLPHLSFPWTIRIMGFVVLLNVAVVLSIVKARHLPRKSRQLIELAAFKELPYLLFTISMFFTLWATYFAYYYVRSYALDKLHVSEASSYNILLIVNAIGIPGRIVPALLADHCSSAITVLIPIIFFAALCLYMWMLVLSFAHEIVWVVFFGFFGAGIQGLIPSTLASLTKDLTKSGTRIGMVFTIISIPCLTGPPLAGKLIQVCNGSYLGAQVWGGSCLLLGGSLLVAARMGLSGSRISLCC